MLSHPMHRALSGLPTTLPSAPRSAPRWAALALAAGLCALASAPAAAQGSGFQAYAQTILYYIDLNVSHVSPSICSQSSASCASSNSYADASGTAAFGSTSATLSVTSVGRSGAGQAEVATAWYDTFTVSSNTLAVGTPVTLIAGTVLQAALVVAAAAPSPYTRAQANIAYGGPDGQSLTFTGTHNGLPMSSFNPFTAYVGGSFTLYGEIFASSATDTGLAPDFGSVDASARYYLDIVGTDAVLSSASGHNYTAAVPEAPAWASLLVGLVLLGWRRRTRP